MQRLYNHCQSLAVSTAYHVARSNNAKKLY
uniref:Uncharacterized protein n=1 Tax=Arundo donax TaxID=35708 RepID=A0A0A8Y8J9_ARUDO